jgi:predicted glutamine amidotransferase
MCRMCLITATNFGEALVPHDMKAQLVHECMLRVLHEDAGQRDGWGVTDMHTLWSSPQFYLDDAPIWLPKVRHDGYILSHLRKASGGTGRTRNENHPYSFKVGDQTLIAAHNGYFDGTAWTHWSNGQPATDSFRALNDLAMMMEERNTLDIDADLINEWLSKYGEGSHYAVILHWRGDIYALRGKTRTLSALQVGNGYLLNTSHTVLRVMREYLDRLYDIKVSEPQAMTDNTMVQFKLGSTHCVVSQLHPVHTRAVVNAHWQQAVSVSPKTSVVVPEERRSDDIVPSGYVVAPSVLPRRARTVTPDDSTTESSGEAFLSMKQRRELWGQIAGRFSPLRRELSLMWAARSLGYLDDAGIVMQRSFLANASMKEFELVNKALLSMKEDGTFIKPFSPIAMAMINWWNHVVQDGFDLELHTEIFVSLPFWLDSRYTRLRDQEGRYDNTSYVMPIWTRYMLAQFGQLQRSQARRWLNLDVLARHIADLDSFDTMRKEPITVSTVAILSGD